MELTSDLSLLWYVLGYFVLMVILGFAYSTKIEKSDDFILASRALGVFVLAGTLMATWMGSGSVTGGGTSLAYSYGLGPGLLYAVPSIIGIAVLYFIAARIRSLNSYTVAAIIEEKYGRFARLLAAVIVLLAYVGIVSYQMKGLGFVLNVTTGMPVFFGTVIGGLVIIILATSGGLKSVAPTDAVSSCLMVIGLVVAVPAIYFYAGGWDNIVANVPEGHYGSVTGSLSVVQMLGYLVPTLFLLLGDQNMYQRITASKSDASTKRSSIYWVIGTTLSTVVIALIAFMSSSVFKKIDPGMAMIATTLVMPSVVGGLLLAAISAFIVTTGDSFLLSAATTVTYDLIKRFVARDATDAQLLRMTRVFVVVLGVVAFVLMQFFPTILSVQMYAYTVYGAGITPALLAAVLWRRVNLYGGVSSMLTGVVVTLVWELLLNRPFDLNSSVISIPAAVIVLIVVTLVTPASRRATASA